MLKGCTEDNAYWYWESSWSNGKERLSILHEAFFLATDPCFLLEFFDILGNILLEHYIINVWEDVGRWRAFHANTFGSRRSQHQHIVELLLDGEVGAASQKENNWAEHDMIPSVIRLFLLDGLVKSAVVEIMAACWIQEQ